jgi:alpha-beta hydrolase superfamily lysophospholipase
MSMQESTFILTAADGVEVYVYRWWPKPGLPKPGSPASAPKAALQIVHGLAEHAGRYARLAAALTAAGYAVYASDLRGHGRTAKSPEDLGLFAEHDGWRKCMDDLWQLRRHITTELPAAQTILLGHSMGATLARQFMEEHGDAVAGVVLSGCSGQPTSLAAAGRLIARLERIRLGRRGRSSLIQSLSIDAFNKRFEPARTQCDWLSRDPAEVDKYVNDPLCGFASRVQLWIDLLDAWVEIAKSASAALVRKDLPVHVISGSHDPVSAGGKALEPMLAGYRAAGLQNLSRKSYPEARHELLNETNRDEVVRDLLQWLETVTGR